MSPFFSSLMGFGFATGIITTTFILIYQYMTTQHEYRLLADFSGYTSFVAETELDHYFKYDRRLHAATRFAGEEFKPITTVPHVEDPAALGGSPVDGSLNRE